MPDNLFPGSDPFGSSTPLTQDATSRPQAPQANADPAGFLSGVAAGFMNETELGAGVDAIRRADLPEAEPDYDFNPFAYARQMEDPSRRAIANKLAAEGVFDRERGDYHTADDVEQLVDQYTRETERQMIAGQSTGSAVGYIAGSFVSLSTLVPFYGIGAKGTSAVKAGLRSGVATGAVEAGLQGTLASQQLTRDPTTAYLDVGVATVLGGGIGVFGQLLTNGALRRTVQQAVDVNVHQDPLAVNRSMGAAENPDPSFQAANQGDLGKTYGGWYDHLPYFSENPVSATYRLAGKGANAAADIMRRYGVNVPGEGHKAGIAERMSVEDLAEIEYTTHANDAENAFFAAQQEFRRMNPDVTPEDFNMHASLLHEFPDHTTGNAALDASIRQAVDAPRGSRSFFNRMYEHMNEFGMFPKNQIAEYQKGLEKATKELEAAKRAAAQTPSGRARKQGTKVADQKQRVVARLEKRIKKLETTNADRRNYFTQAWSKVGLLENADQVKAILAREFSDATTVAERHVERAFREMSPADADPKRAGYQTVDEDALEDALEAFEAGGFDALPDALKDHIRKNIGAYADTEAGQLVNDMVAQGAARGVGMLDPDLTPSGRTMGRRLNLSKETTMELMRLGVLESDPARTIRAYNADVGPRLSMRRVFGVADQEGVEELVRLGLDDIDAAQAAGKMTAAEANKLKMDVFGRGTKTGRGLFHVMHDRVMNRAGFDDVGDGMLAWMGSQAMKYNFVARLGGMTISAVTDLATMSVQAGLSRSPALKAAFVKNLISKNISNIQAIPNRELRQLLVGIENYNAFNGRAAQLGGATVDPTGRAGFGLGKTRQVSGKIESGSNVAAEVFSEATGMNQWNRAGKHTAMNFLIMRMHDIGSGVVEMSAREVENFARWGLTKGDLEWVAKQAADDVGGVKYPNPDAWPKTAQGAEMRLKLFAALKRAGEEAVTTVRKGDKNWWMDGPIGRLFGQFTTFSYAWSGRVGRRNLKHGIMPRDAEAWSFLGQSLGYGVLAFMLKQTIKGHDLPDPSEPEGLTQYIYEGIDRGGLLMQFTAPTNGMVKLASSLGVPYLPQASRFEARNFTNAIAGPTFGLIGDAAEFAYGIGDDKRGDMALKAYRLMPFNNVFYLDALMRRVLFDQ